MMTSEVGLSIGSVCREFYQGELIKSASVAASNIAISVGECCSTGTDRILQPTTFGTNDYATNRQFLPMQQFQRAHPTGKAPP